MQGPFWGIPGAPAQHRHTPQRCYQCRMRTHPKPGLLFPGSPRSGCPKTHPTPGPAPAPMSSTDTTAPSLSLTPYKQAAAAEELPLKSGWPCAPQPSSAVWSVRNQLTCQPPRFPHCARGIVKSTSQGWGGLQESAMERGQNSAWR